MRPSARRSSRRLGFRSAALTAAVASTALLTSVAQAASLSVPLDHSARLAVSGHAASVVVGNPLVADVTVVDSRTLYVTGKKFGTTDVVVLDPLGRTVYASDIQVVNGAGKHVSVYRAGLRADLACDPTCATPDPTPAASTAAAGAPDAGASAPASAGAAVGALAGGALGNALGAVAPR